MFQSIAPTQYIPYFIALPFIYVCNILASIVTLPQNAVTTTRFLSATIITPEISESMSLASKHFREDLIWILPLRNWDWWKIITSGKEKTMKAEIYHVTSLQSLKNVITRITELDLTEAKKVTISDSGTKSSRQRGLQWIWYLMEFYQINPIN